MTDSIEFMTITEPGNPESVKCVPGCENQAHVAGFVPVLADGTFNGECGETWEADGKLIACMSCGRVASEAHPIGGTHLQVSQHLEQLPTLPDRW